MEFKPVERFIKIFTIAKTESEIERVIAKKILNSWSVMSVRRAVVLCCDFVTSLFLYRVREGTKS